MYICYLILLSDALFDSQGLIKKTERNKLAGKNVASKRFLYKLESDFVNETKNPFTNRRLKKL